MPHKLYHGSSRGVHCIPPELRGHGNVPEGKHKMMHCYCASERGIKKVQSRFSAKTCRKAETLKAKHQQRVAVFHTRMKFIYTDAATVLSSPAQPRHLGNRLRKHSPMETPRGNCTALWRRELSSSSSSACFRRAAGRCSITHTLLSVLHAP